MKPILLEMEAFGSYSKKTAIDFRKLGEKGVFLINGNTGSGKTTIFDAIVYALYGNTSSNEARSLVSDYVDLDTVTPYVKFTFQSNGKYYIAKRIPTFKRPKNKTVKQTTFVHSGPWDTLEEALESQGKTSPCYLSSNIGAQVIGLDASSFTQICMLAQGKFERFLLASSKEKRDLLRNIFHTENYSVLCNVLREDANRCKEVRDATEERIRGILQNIPPLLQSEIYRDNHELQIEYTQIPKCITTLSEAQQTALQTTQEQLQQIEKAIKENTRQQEQLKQYQETAHRYQELLLAKNQLASIRAGLARESVLLEKEAEGLQSYPDTIAVEKGRIPEYTELDEKKKQYDSQVQKCKEMEDVFQQLQAHCVDLEKDAGDIAELTLQKKEIETALEQLAEAEKLQSLCNDTQRQLLALRQEYKTLDTNRTKIQKELEQYKEILQNTSQSAIQTESTKNALAQKKQIADTLTKRMEALSQLGTQERMAEQSRVAYQTDDAAYRNSHDIYERANQAYMDDMAGILARESLTEGKPCPVCGSIHHPSPAQSSQKAPTKSALERMKKNQEQAEKARQVSAEKAGRESEKAIQMRTQLTKEMPELGDNWNLMEAEQATLQQLQTANREICEYQKQLELYQSQTLQHQEAEKKIQTLSEELDKQTVQLNNKKVQGESTHAKFEEQKKQLEALQGHLQYTNPKDAQAAKVQVEIRITATQELDAFRKQRDTQQHNLTMAIALKETSQKAYQTLQEKLPFSNLQAAQSHILQLEKALDAFRQKQESHQQKLQEQEQKYQAVQGKIEEQKQALESLPHPDEEETKNAANILTAKKQVALDAINSYSSTIDLLEQTRTNLEAEVETLQAQEKKHSMVAELANVLTAKSANAIGKINLETYVQIQQFKQTIFRANKRLMCETGGKFELVYRDTAKNKQSEVGLDLQILDHYTNKERDVNSLSGGEKFQASMALALGLAEQIQCDNGGIQLDTMFIDEGFGSLDEEAMEMAVRTLQSLSGNDRLIGIISHVNGLQDYIHKQIVVTKTESNGSQVNIIS